MSDETILKPSFFDRHIHDVARDLLGRHLVRSVDGQITGGRIVEVEVYEGQNDRASHARSGAPTKRTAPMFAQPGTIYVYTIYGMYQCLNLRAPTPVGPGAILIRACQPLMARAVMARRRGLVDDADDYAPKMDRKLMSGPGKLCQALSIDTDLSGTMIGEQLALEGGEPIWRQTPERIEATPRRGLNRKTCGDCVDRLWRYVVCDSRWLS